MKHSSNLALATVAAVMLLSPAMAAEPYGKWVRPSNGAEVSFFNCGGKLCGKVIGKGASSAKVGTMIVGGAAKSGANEWKGNLLNPEDGKTYSGVITHKRIWFYQMISINYRRNLRDYFSRIRKFRNS